MLCGPPNIWPQPSIKTVLGSKALKLSSSSFKLNVDTKFNNVNTLLKHAYNIFVEEVKHLEANTQAKTSNHNKNDDNDNYLENNDGVKQHKQEQINKDGRDFATGPSDISDNFVPLLAAFSGQSYDINNFLVNIRVYADGDTYLTLKTDESYNLTLSCK